MAKKTFLLCLILVGCGGKDEELPVPVVEGPEIRRLTLNGKADGQSLTLDQFPDCPANCWTWQAADTSDLYFCFQTEWLLMRDYMSPEQAMYCRIY